MDYSKMSDYEISCEVGRAIGFTDYLLARSEQKNYCNSWADAGPIIQENSISLISDWNEEGLWGATFQPWIYSEHENPLRAAMECYLMMHDKGEE
ncbi:phage protein NinX family protein [Mixta calida]|uniref:phage protein NinX family protein n=1 Tax=Mixta calida TaxID=665913 RepID=UPI00403B1DA8